ncbi:MAG: hypothetical protein IMF11_03100 [Proteobacteria bacterium]|nr:hypothetical protein [Pseudomonadota bacterium]
MAKAQVEVYIEIPLPFCLYLEDGIYSVMHEGKIYECRLKKAWSELAEGSANLDIEEPAEAKFLVKAMTGEITTCRNIEIEFDKRGSLRHSIFSAVLRFPVGTSIEKTAESIPNEVLISKAMSLINKLLEAYRLVTGAFYATRIGYYDLIQVRDRKIVPLIKIDKPKSETQRALIMGFNLFEKTPLTSAKPNLSQEEHASIKELLLKEFTTPIERMLVLNAKDHALSDKYDMAVFELGTALEVTINNLLSRDKTDDEIPLRFEDKYDSALKDLTGHSLKEDNELWQSLKKIWNIRCNIAHRGQCVWTVKKGAVRETIDTEEKVAPLIEKTERIMSYIDRLTTGAEVNKS